MAAAIATLNNNKKTSVNNAVNKNKVNPKSKPVALAAMEDEEEELKAVENQQKVVKQAVAKARRAATQEAKKKVAGKKRAREEEESQEEEEDATAAEDPEEVESEQPDAAPAADAVDDDGVVKKPLLVSKKLYEIEHKERFPKGPMGRAANNVLKMLAFDTEEDNKDDEEDEDQYKLSEKEARLIDDALAGPRKVIGPKGRRITVDPPRVKLALLNKAMAHCQRTVAKKIHMKVVQLAKVMLEHMLTPKPGEVNSPYVDYVELGKRYQVLSDIMRKHNQQLLSMSNPLCSKTLDVMTKRGFEMSDRFVDLLIRLCELLFERKVRTMEKVKNKTSRITVMVIDSRIADEVDWQDKNSVRNILLTGDCDTLRHLERFSKLDGARRQAAMRERVVLKLKLKKKQQEERAKEAEDADVEDEEEAAPAGEGAGAEKKKKAKKNKAEKEEPLPQQVGPSPAASKRFLTSLKVTRSSADVLEPLNSLVYNVMENVVVHACAIKIAETQLMPIIEKQLALKEKKQQASLEKEDDDEESYTPLLLDSECLRKAMEYVVAVDIEQGLCTQAQVFERIVLMQKHVEIERIARALQQKEAREIKKQQAELKKKQKEAAAKGDGAGAGVADAAGESKDEALVVVDRRSTAQELIERATAIFYAAEAKKKKSQSQNKNNNSKGSGSGSGSGSGAGTAVVAESKAEAVAVADSEQEEQEAEEVEGSESERVFTEKKPRNKKKATSAADSIIAKKPRRADPRTEKRKQAREALESSLNQPAPDETPSNFLLRVGWRILYDHVNSLSTEELEKITWNKCQAVLLAEMTKRAPDFPAKQVLLAVDEKELGQWRQWVKDEMDKVTAAEKELRRAEDKMLKAQQEYMQLTPVVELMCTSLDTDMRTAVLSAVFASLSQDFKQNTLKMTEAPQPNPALYNALSVDVRTKVERFNKLHKKLAKTGEMAIQVAAARRAMENAQKRVNTYKAYEKDAELPPVRQHLRRMCELDVNRILKKKKEQEEKEKLQQGEGEALVEAPVPEPVAMPAPAPVPADDEPVVAVAVEEQVPVPVPAVEPQQQLLQLQEQQQALVAMEDETQQQEEEEEQQMVAEAQLAAAAAGVAVAEQQDPLALPEADLVADSGTGAGVTDMDTNEDNQEHSQKNNKKQQDSSSDDESISSEEDEEEGDDDDDGDKNKKRRYIDDEAAVSADDE